jgi:hydrogenase nickel incorporation protein HypB
MCDTCGCGAPATRTIEVHERLLAAHASAARHNREHFARRRLFAVNVMGAPGSGKTALLEAAARRSAGRWRVAVVEGDQATDRDSRRIRAAGAAACQVETGLGCHLDPAQVHAALDELGPGGDGGLLFIENVGNLVCPALFDLGEHLRVLVTSPTEGEDKALKYPPMFRAADLVVLNKCDLLKHLRFDLGEWTGYVHAINPRARIIMVSALGGEGVDEWLAALDERRRALLGASEDRT